MSVLGFAVFFAVDGMLTKFLVVIAQTLFWFRVIQRTGEYWWTRCSGLGC